MTTPGGSPSGPMATMEGGGTLAPEPRRILVVEDSPTVLVTLRRALAGQGHEVLTAQDGLEAITKVYTTSPDLVVSDILMPEVNGYHLCRLIKKDPDLESLPVILLTSLHARENRFWAFRCGADRFVSKDEDPSVLLSAVRELADQRRRHPPAHTPMSFLFVDPHGTLVKEMLNQILDRMLFDAIVESEVQRLGMSIDRPDAMMTGFFDLLSQVIEYDLATLVVGGASATIWVHPWQASTQGWIEERLGEVMRRLGLDPTRTHVVRLQGSAGAVGSQEGPSEVVAVPIDPSALELGELAVHQVGGIPYGPSDRALLARLARALKPVVERLVGG